MDLHIFEPRYREMLEDALEDAWVFAVGTLISPEEEPYENCVAEIGTLCLVTQSETLEDGRSVLMISGLGLVRFEEWLSGSPYPKARISEIKPQEVEGGDKETIKSLLLDTVPAQIEGFPEDVKGMVMENFKSIPEVSTLIDTIVHNFISDSDFRLEMLKETDQSARAARLISVLS